MRSLFLNLKDKGNPGLRNEIVIGQVSAEQVVHMTKEVSGYLWSGVLHETR
jgi:transcription elongation factor S-II